MPQSSVRFAVSAKLGGTAGHISVGDGGWKLDLHILPKKRRKAPGFMYGDISHSAVRRPLLSLQIERMCYILNLRTETDSGRIANCALLGSVSVRKQNRTFRQGVLHWFKMITYKYRLYRNKKNQRLHQTIDVAGIIWNHCVALQRRYYSLTGKYISRYTLQKHIAKLRNRAKYRNFRMVGSQAVQEIVERLDKAYQRFFKYKQGKTTQQAGRPSFKKVKKYKSFTLKQAGWKLLDPNRIWIQGTVYKYSKSREIEGTIKTVTVKRDELGNLWLCVVIENGDNPSPVISGNIVGMDFGLKTFLTLSDGTTIESPQFFKQSLNEIRRCNRSLSRKQKGSHNRRKAKRDLAIAHARIKNLRTDWFFKLAHSLVDRFDVIVLEDLNIKAMQRLWGRKVSDLGFASFVHILKHVAAKRGRTVYFVDRFYPSSKTCSACGAVNHLLELSDRRWVCTDCGVIHDRDHNAAVNLHREGASSLGLGDVRPAQQAVSV